MSTTADANNHRTPSEQAAVGGALDESALDEFHTDDLDGRAAERLKAAFRMERLAGLRLATRTGVGVLAAIAVFLAFLVPPPWLFGYQAGVAALALIMLVHDRVQRAAPDRVWISYLFVGLLFATMTLVMILPGSLIGTPGPDQMFLRKDTGVYYFVVIALVSLNQAPGLTLWAGFAGLLSWSTVIAFFASKPGSLVLGDLTPELAWQDVQTILLDPHYVALDVRVQDVVVMLTVTVILATVVARSKRLVLRHALVERERGNLARYFPPQIVDRLSHTDEPLNTVRRQEIAVLFADIVGFTRLAEQEEPERVIALLRSFHRRLEQAVFNNGGTLDKFLGDGLMATFGTPEPGPRDAVNALAAARDMRAAIDTWNRKRTAAGRQPIRLSIGLHYGPVVVGDIGTERRLEFAVLGDTVNVASRLEALTRSLQCRVIASAALVERAEREDAQEAAALLAEYRASEPKSLRGRKGRVAVWVAGRQDPPPLAAAPSAETAPAPASR